MAPTSPGKVDNWLRQGLALHQSGRLAEAEPIYRRVLERQPRHPAANHLLGLVRLQQGHPGDAVPLLLRAVAARGTDPQYHCNLGVALNAAGQPERALPSFDRAIALKPDYAEAHSNRGMALKSLGRLAAAAESYREALRLRPKEPGFHLNLANVLAQSGDALEAEAGFRRALSLRPQYPAAQSGLCQALSALGRPQEAIAAGEAAIAARPDEAEYHRVLGFALWVAGRPTEALVSYRRALALRPGNMELYRLISLLLRREPGDPEIGAMQELVQSAIPDEQRMHLHFALGLSFDDIGDAESSFTHYVAGNALQRRHMPFSLAAVEAEAAALQRQFAGATAETAAGTGAGPIFIIGLPRSGKSTLEAMLGRHPATHKAGELPLLGRLVSDLRAAHGGDQWPSGAIAELGSRYLDYAARLAPGGERIIDTMPLNFWHVGFIRLALPQARIIHCRREPLAHCAAIFQKYFALPGFAFASDLGDIAAYYRTYSELMGFWRRQFPGAILDLDTLDLQASPGPAMREVLEFCGLSSDPACLVHREVEPRIGGEDAPTLGADRDRLRHYLPALRPVLGV